MELQADLLAIWIFTLNKRLKKGTIFDSLIKPSVVLALEESLAIVYLKAKLFELIASFGYNVENAIIETLAKKSQKQASFSSEYDSCFIGYKLSK